MAITFLSKKKKKKRNIHCPRLTLVWPRIFLLPKAGIFSCSSNAEMLIWAQGLITVFYWVQLVAQSCPTLYDPMDPCQASLSITNSRAYPNSCPLSFILCRALFLPPLIFPSIRVFSNKSALHIRWPKYWSFSFNISPSNEHSGLISFRMDWLDLLAVQGTLKSLLQQHSSKASILQPLSS